MELEIEPTIQCDEHLFDGKAADVTIVVDGVRFPVHRAILCRHSRYFRSLLEKKTWYSQREIVLKEFPPTGFKHVTEFIYTKTFDPSKLDTETLLRTLDALQFFDVEELENTIVEYLRETISVQNACAILEKSLVMDYEALQSLCFRFVEKAAEEIVKSEGFSRLSYYPVMELLYRDAFCAPEIDIFRAVQRWCAAEDRDDSDTQTVLELVRLPLISVMDLMSTVKNSGLVSEDRLNEVIMQKDWLADDRDEMLALKNGRRIYAPVDTDAGIYHDTFKYRWRCTDANGGSFELSGPSIVNHLEFRLSGRESPYYVEVSTNRVEWRRIIDYSQYPCSGPQNHHFDPEMVRYIRVMSPRPSVNLKFTKLLVNYVKQRVHKTLGFLVPRGNVASEIAGAKVVACGGGFDEMISGGSGWTWHRMGRGSIVVRLPQPYIVDSMSFKLRSDEILFYEIKVSLNGRDWMWILTNVTLVGGHQQVNFPRPLPVLFIKLTGSTIRGTGDFFCADFECPAPTRSTYYNSITGADMSFNHTVEIFDD